MTKFASNQIVNINGHSNNTSNVIADVWMDVVIGNYGLVEHYYIQSPRTRAYTEVVKHSNGKTWYRR